MLRNVYGKLRNKVLAEIQKTSTVIYYFGTVLSVLPSALQHGYVVLNKMESPSLEEVAVGRS